MLYAGNVSSPRPSHRSALTSPLLTVSFRAIIKLTAVHFYCPIRALEASEFPSPIGNSHAHTAYTEPNGGVGECADHHRTCSNPDHISCGVVRL